MLHLQRLYELGGAEVPVLWEPVEDKDEAEKEGGDYIMIEQNKCDRCGTHGLLPNRRYCKRCLENGPTYAESIEYHTKQNEDWRK